MEIGLTLLFEQNWLREILSSYFSKTMDRQSYTPARKVSILKWRVAHRERYNAYKNAYFKGYYARNAEHLKRKRMGYYYFAREWKRLCGCYFEGVL